MTKQFGTRITCEHCGKQTTVETAFCRWMRSHPKLQPDSSYIVRTDTDHTVLKFMTHVQGERTRDFQLIMDVEIKEHGLAPDRAQRDILEFKKQMTLKNSHNRHGAKTYWTHKLWSFFSWRHVNVRYLGLHTLQFEKTSPIDSRWIKWDGKKITEETLVGILALDLHPDHPHRPMAEFLRDRHRQHKNGLLFEK